ncbi:DRE2 [Hepatospora eriocheir]|uniref:DRE2 n=1 Tax=Hepatospora eriocheir TaxID=1081669 RepID=A0A1X0Q8T2_9MICR|nr:DRE2 [Hepatospora eriocheir]
MTDKNQINKSENNNVFCNEDEFEQYKSELLNKPNKRCTNCTCGKYKSEPVKEEKFESKCGNCNLGDAYRCSSCPYLGLPSFKEGDNIEFDLDKFNDL